MKAEKFTLDDQSSSPTKRKAEPCFEPEHVSLLLNRKHPAPFHIPSVRLNAVIKTMTHELELLERMLQPGAKLAAIQSAATVRRVHKALKSKLENSEG